MGLQTLPPPKKALKAAYHELIEDIDSLITKLTGDRFRQTLQCRPGCAECCIGFSILPLEAALVKEGLKQLEPVDGQEGKSCQLLAKNRCSIYEIRPIICRTQGLPIAYIDESSSCIEVSACLLNFPDDHQFEQEDLLFMDQFNSRLAELNIQYCLTVSLEPRQRIAIADLCKNSIP
jgi:Fe-S-cluster containining protein